MNHFPSLVALALCSIVGATSCNASRSRLVPPEPEPIRIGPDGSAPIAFKRVLVRVPSGSAIGAHHDGLLSIPQFTRYWTADLTEGSLQLNIEASEQLRGLGYTVLGYENLLFAEDNSSKARFQLGGTVTALTWNTYAPLAGNYSKASIDVEWQVYDTYQKQVVFSQASHGEASLDGCQSPVLRKAFSSALTKLTAETRFAQALSKHSGADPTTAPPADLDIALIATVPESSTFDFEAVKRSTVILHVGMSGGSGFLITPDGYLLTAAHVVRGVDEAEIEFAGGVRLPGKVVRRSEHHDVALLKVPGSGFSPLPLRTDGRPSIGSELHAVGTPLSDTFSFSLTKGIVSGVREVEGVTFLQTDASVNRGCSGGPLVDSRGQAVGIVSWKIVADGVEGFAFGVPVDSALEQLGVRTASQANLSKQ